MLYPRAPSATRQQPAHKAIGPGYYGRLTSGPSFRLRSRNAPTSQPTPTDTKQRGALAPAKHVLRSVSEPQSQRGPLLAPDALLRRPHALLRSRSLGTVDVTTISAPRRLRTLTDERGMGRMHAPNNQPPGLPRKPIVYGTFVPQNPSPGVERRTQARRAPAGGDESPAGEREEKIGEALLTTKLVSSAPRQRSLSPCGGATMSTYSSRPDRKNSPGVQAPGDDYICIRRASASAARMSLEEDSSQQCTLGVRTSPVQAVRGLVGATTVPNVEGVPTEAVWIRPEAPPVFSIKGTR